MLHTVEQGIQVRGTGGVQALFIFADELKRVIGLMEASLQYGKPCRIGGALAQVAHPQVVLIDDGAAIVTLDTCQHIEQGALAGTVAGYEAHALSLGHTK